MMPTKQKPTIVTSSSEPDPNNEPMQIPKPGKSKLDLCKSTLDPNISGVETLLTALPHHRIADANDWVRLHPDEPSYWSSEYCFVSVPIKGQMGNMLHLIFEHLATRHLESKKIQRFRLALATKPHDVFFLCHVPTRNLDNSWNDTSVKACLQAKTKWTQATSQKAENKESYKINFTRDPDAFPEPNWPKQSLEELIDVTFAGCIIDSEDHPGLLRLVGAKPSLS
jgi:hypothetical protein